LTDLARHLVTTAHDALTDGDLEVCRVGAEELPHPDDDGAREMIDGPTPATVRRSHRTAAPIVEQHGEAIGRAYDQEQSRVVAYRSVGLLVEPAWRCLHHARAVHLVIATDLLALDAQKLQQPVAVGLDRRRVVSGT